MPIFIRLYLNKTIYLKGYRISVIKMPRKYSVKWLYAAGVLFLLTMIQLIVFAGLSGMTLTAENVTGFAILSAFISAAVTAGGWLDKKIYFFTVLLFCLTAAGYMFYTALAKTADGWTDLVGIISFMFIIAAGVTAGIILQFLAFILTKIKKRHGS